MSIQSTQYSEYIELIKDNEEAFIEEIQQYNIKDAMVQLTQLRNANKLIKQNREKELLEIVQLGKALQINLKDWKDKKISSEETLEAMSTWLPIIPAYDEKIKIIEQDASSIDKIMDELISRINHELESHDLDKTTNSSQEELDILSTMTEMSSSSDISKKYGISSGKDAEVSDIKREIETSNAKNNEQIICLCKSKCESCYKLSDPTLSYCINKCVMCIAERKIRAKNIKTTTQGINLKIMTSSSPIISSPVNNISLTIQGQQNKQLHQLVDEQGLINTNDKYFFVILTSDRTDGSNDYIIDALLKNFTSMFPDSFPAKAACYVVGFTSENIPYLNGLIRYDSRGKYRISPKSTHIRNLISSMTTGERNLRFYDVQNLTKYSNKRYKTKIQDIQEKYRLMMNIGQIKGNIETDFLY